MKFISYLSFILLLLFNPILIGDDTREFKPKQIPVVESVNSKKDLRLDFINKVLSRKLKSEGLNHALPLLEKDGDIKDAINLVLEENLSERLEYGKSADFIKSFMRLVPDILEVIKEVLDFTEINT